VLGFLSLLLVITYLDRICISVAGPRMQQDMHIGAVGWGWITGVFAFAYAVFEIPTGALGDRIGPRRVLTRIVLWWSAFTSLTGAVSGYYPLLATRFCFGMGEAGAFPNASVAIARWFPVHERGRAFGIILMAGQIGAATAPLLVVPIQVHYGWRASFYTFGFLGVAWSAVWYWWFRDTPSEKAGVTQAELEETRDLVAKAGHGMPWGIALRSGNLWAVLTVSFCYFYSIFFFQSWFHTFLVRGRGYTESDLLLSTLPYLVAACANACGGVATNALARKLGLRWGRSIGLVGLGSAAIFTVAVPLTRDRLWVLIFLSLLYGGITLQQPAICAVCLDIGGQYAGATIGAFNTASQVGSLVSSVVFGYMVDRTGSYDAPFLPMAVLLAIGALLWLKIDPARQLIEATAAVSKVALSVDVE
jgi:ACS family glucarate transporter-like MFS transporter